LNLGFVWSDFMDYTRIKTKKRDLIFEEFDGRQDDESDKMKVPR